jgi:uncharacterized protein (TIRG00374 family)
MSVESVHSFWHATEAFWHGLTGVAVGALIVALVLHLTNLALRTRAWRNILQAAHPELDVRWRTVAAAYVGGVGANSFAPARGGDVMKVVIVARGVPGISYPAVASSLLAETLFDFVVGGLVMLWAYSTGAIPHLPDLRNLAAFEWSFFANHVRAFFVVLAVILIAVGAYFSWIEHHVTAFYARLRNGLAILGRPRDYLRYVVSYQALGWCLRIGSMYWFLEAFHIHASLRNALLALVASSVSTALPLTPGGAGTQQALLVYMFRGVASSSAVLSFSVGMQFAITVTNALAAAIVLAIVLRRLPWKTRLAHIRGASEPAG